MAGAGLFPPGVSRKKNQMVQSGKFFEHNICDSTILEQWLPCKELVHIGKRLKLKSIARRVEKEHGRLFTHLSLEADIRLNDETNTGSAQTIRQGLPVLHGKYHPKVRHRNVVTIYRIMMLPVLFERGFEMSDDLVAKKIEVNPLCGASPLRTAQQDSIKSPRRL
jgi:hypothetical protein